MESLSFLPTYIFLLVWAHGLGFHKLGNPWKTWVATMKTKNMNVVVIFYGKCTYCYHWVKHKQCVHCIKIEFSLHIVAYTMACLGYNNFFDVLYMCLPICFASPTAQKNYGSTKLSHVPHPFLSCMTLLHFWIYFFQRTLHNVNVQLKIVVPKF